MSGFASILDEDGNINTKKLTKELKGALEFDVKYKQTDNMKKRAIRTAGSYDEFKAMVACAHLKKLSKTEVESLSHVKKGWKKPVTSAEKASTAALLEMEIEQENLEKMNLNQAPKLMSKDKKPKTCMELERDLRRLQSNSEKFDFLMSVGAKTTLSLLKKGADVDCIEDVLTILMTERARMDQQYAEAQTQKEFDVTGSEKVKEHEGEVADEGDKKKIVEHPLLKWLGGIAKLDKFELMLRFANKDIISSINAFLESTESSVALKEKFCTTNS